MSSFYSDNKKNGDDISEAPVAGWAPWFVLASELWAEVTCVTSGLSTDLLVWDLPELSSSSGMVIDSIWYKEYFLSLDPGRGWFGV